MKKYTILLLLAVLQLMPTPPKELSIKTKLDISKEDLTTPPLTSHSTCNDLAQWEDLEEELGRLSVTPSHEPINDGRQSVFPCNTQSHENFTSISSEEHVQQRKDRKKLRKQRQTIYAAIRLLQRTPAESDEEEDTLSPLCKRSRMLSPEETDLKRSKSNGFTSSCDNLN